MISWKQNAIVQQRRRRGHNTRREWREGENQRLGWARAGRTQTNTQSEDRAGGGGHQVKKNVAVMEEENWRRTLEKNGCVWNEITSR